MKTRKKSLVFQRVGRYSAFSLFQVARNGELTMELLTLVNAKTALSQQNSSAKYQEEAKALAREEERIRGKITRLTRHSQYTAQVRR